MFTRYTCQLVCDVLRESNNTEAETGAQLVYGDVVYAQIWQVLTLKNCMDPFSYASAAYVVASALVSVRLFCKN